MDTVVVEEPTHRIYRVACPKCAQVWYRLLHVSCERSQGICGRCHSLLSVERHQASLIQSAFDIEQRELRRKDGLVV